ncbi:lycopene cyclase domain-containing protein [Amycolatopsis sp. NPDC051071]|uniref:lycopene cyclase domain-containing protein n=1 Tax=Amycolatopsis sp. NPDC051071 TaxID=3154637 RepID=UPI00341ADDB9
MTYFAFLTCFVLPPLVLVGRLVAVASHPSRATRHGRTEAVALIVMLGLALAWTTPWDSWIIARGVWSYPDGAVVATWHGIPVEEYLFMAGQTLLVGLWTLRLVATSGTPAPAVPERFRRAATAMAWMTAAGVGAALAATQPSTLYLGSMLAWYGPLFALQRAVGADILRAWSPMRWRALVPVAYLWCVDRVAIGAGTWSISEQHTSGLRVGGLPVEEMVFFLLTSMLVVDGLLLALHPATAVRLHRSGLVPRTHRET